jgi:hypothetical protein
MEVWFGREPRGLVKVARNPLDASRAFDVVVVLAMSRLVLSAYVDAYAHVKIPGTVIWAAANGPADDEAEFETAVRLDVRRTAADHAARERGHGT